MSYVLKGLSGLDIMGSNNVHDDIPDACALANLAYEEAQGINIPLNLYGLVGRPKSHWR